MEAVKYNLLSKLNENVLSIIEDNSIVSIIDVYGRIEYVNTLFCDTLEYTESELLGETLDLLKSPIHIEALYKNLWKTIKAGHKWTGILATKKSNGKPITLDTIIVPMKKDNTLMYVIVSKDVTRLHAEKVRLKESDYRSNVFLENMPMHVFSITKYGKILNTNKSYCNQEKENLIDTYIYDHIGSNSYDIFKKNVDEVFKNKISKQFEFFDFDEDGRKLFFSSIISPVFTDFGGLTSATVCIHDITNYKGISKEERDREAKYRLIYKSINVGIIVVADDKGKIREWNKGAKLAFGYSESEILGRPLTILTSLSYRESNITAFVKAVKKIKNNINSDIIELQCVRKNGEEFPVEFALSSIRVNKKTSYCAMMHDISKRKSLQNKLKQKTKDLEQFLYRSAHDLKAPFASAQGLLNLLKEEKNKEKAQVLIDMLSETIDSGRVLSNNLSEASMVLAKNYEYKTIDFNDIVNDVLKTLSNATNFECIDFKISIDDHKVFTSKPKLMHSIFQNLIHNAIKYSNKQTDAHTPCIDITVKTKIDDVSIIVRDNGKGINLKCIDKIFDLYYRSNNENTPGNGIGLYIVKNIVDGLDGSISVSSELNIGTCFEIHLPNY
ncbi:PAS domain S-box protein [Psychroserpens damuponensis]|uniref:PAS domain S-box protein n=1 Tax=Psychroserpens damuponensis TaxID=943936 RepID=UPI0006938F6B|nr:PAS domain S-box protein [Psychroserpens damuponensis]